MTEAAIAYMREVGHEWAIRFDIISVIVRSDTQYTVQHIEDAFFAGM